jgi:hypothetical protein
MNDLHKIAFDYRNAVLPDDAHEAWIELEQYVKQLINEEREACAKAVSDVLYGQDGCGKAIEAIRARGQGWRGLTEDEVSEILDEEIGFNSCFGPETDFARAIEAKLKEKNT